MRCGILSVKKKETLGH